MIKRKAFYHILVCIEKKSEINSEGCQNSNIYNTYYIYAGIYIKIHVMNSSKIIKCDLRERKNKSPDITSTNSCSAKIRTGSMHVNEVTKSI